MDIRQMYRTRDRPRGVVTTRRRGKGRVSAEDLRRDAKALEESFLWAQIHPIMLRLILLGVFPLQTLQHGRVSFKLLSLPMLYCACYYVLCLPLVLLVGWDLIVRTITSDSFTQALMSQFIALWLVPFLLLPFTMWAKAGNFAGYFNDWRHFQINFLRVTNCRLQLEFLSLVRPLMYVDCVVTIPPLILVVYFTTYLSWHQIPTVCLNASLIYCPFIYLWFFNCKAMVKAGNNVALHFKADIKRQGCHGHLVTEYKMLWLQLSSLTTCWSYATGRSYGSNFLTFMWFGTVTVYGTVASWLAKEYSMMILFTWGTICDLSLLFMICTWAHWVPISVKTSIELELNRLVTSNMDAAALEEVKSFLQATSMNPSSITLGGFATVNKELSIAIAVTILTYLIVMLQFQLGRSTGDVTTKYNNATLI